MKHVSLIKDACVGSGTLPRESMPSTVTGRLPSLEDLEAYALNQWEVVTRAWNIAGLTIGIHDVPANNIIYYYY